MSGRKKLCQMSEFERGLRYTVEMVETYRIADGPDVTQFGKSQMTMEPFGEMCQRSKSHRERRIRAMLSLARCDGHDQQ